jgi:hypothetical protein
LPADERKKNEEEEEEEEGSGVSLHDASTLGDRLAVPVTFVAFLAPFRDFAFTIAVYVKLL